VFPSQNPVQHPVCGFFRSSEKTARTRTIGDEQNVVFVIGLKYIERETILVVTTSPTGSIATLDRGGDHLLKKRVGSHCIR